MHVKMKNRLAAVGIRIYDHAVTILGEALFTRDLSCGEKQMTEVLFVLPLCCVQRIYVRAGHNQDMRRCLRADVIERDADIILIHLVRRDIARNYLAKQAIIRTHIDQII